MKQYVNLLPSRKWMTVHNLWIFIYPELFSYSSMSGGEKWARCCVTINSLCEERDMRPPVAPPLTDWRMYEFHSVRKQIETATKKLILSTSLCPPFFSRPPLISATPTAIKRFLAEKTLRSKMFWIIFVIDAGPAGLMGGRSDWKEDSHVG